MDSQWMNSLLDLGVSRECVITLNRTLFSWICLIVIAILLSQDELGILLMSTFAKLVFHFFLQFPDWFAVGIYWIETLCQKVFGYYCPQEVIKASFLHLMLFVGVAEMFESKISTAYLHSSLLLLVSYFSGTNLEVLACNVPQPLLSIQVYQFPKKGSLYF